MNWQHLNSRLRRWFKGDNMNYTRALRKYYGIEKRAKKDDNPFMFRNQTEVINTLMQYFIPGSELEKSSQFNFINFIYNLEFQDDDLNDIIQEIQHNLQKDCSYAGSSVLSAYISCLWDKYEEIGLTSKLNEDDIKSFQELASKDLSSDIDLFFKDSEDGFIFVNLMNFKLSQLSKFFEAGLKIISDGKDNSRLFGGSKSSNQDIIDFFKYQDPLYKIDILASIEKLKSNQSYRHMMGTTHNDMINIKVSLADRLAENMYEFIAAYCHPEVKGFPKKIFDYEVTLEGFELSQRVKEDTFNPILNCILPDGRTRVRNRVPHFDLLNCSLVWDFSAADFDTKYIKESNGHGADVFNVLLKPWVIVFNTKYIQEHFHPNYRNIERDIEHPIDYLELEDVLDFEDPEEDIEKHLAVDLSVIKPKVATKGIFSSSARGPNKSDLLMKVFRKMIPDNVEIDDIRIAKISHKTYNTIGYNEQIIDKLLVRIKKYQNKGYIINKASNLVPVLLTSKLDNVFTIFNDEGMIKLLETGVEDVALSTQTMLLSKMGGDQRDKQHSDKEFKNANTNLEVLTYMKDTIVKVHELKKGKMMQSNIKKMSYDRDEGEAVEVSF